MRKDKLDCYVNDLVIQSPEPLIRKRFCAKMGESVGNELPRNRVWLLESLQQELARVITQGNEYQQGYRDALSDVIASYKTAVKKDIADSLDDPEALYDDPTRWNVNGRSG